jgi:hypothetical protein
MGVFHIYRGDQSNQCPPLREHGDQIGLR